MTPTTHYLTRQFYSCFASVILPVGILIAQVGAACVHIIPHNPVRSKVSHRKDIIQRDRRSLWSFRVTLRRAVESIIGICSGLIGLLPNPPESVHHTMVEEEKRVWPQG